MPGMQFVGAALGTVNPNIAVTATSPGVQARVPPHRAPPAALPRRRAARRLTPAVRQGPPLLANLRHALLGEPLEEYEPQEPV